MSWVKLAVGMVFMALATVAHAVVLLALLPWRNARIRSCNHWGHVVGRACMALSGSTVSVEGQQHLDGARPAIYVSNHTSVLDIFLGIWLAPVGTVGVAKKEVIFYPFFGQLYWMSGHLRIDRGNHDRAVAAMRELGDIVRRYKLSIWMWPEGTRSRDGRLRPFKKGLVHLAVETGLPVVPVVVVGAHRAWEKGTQRIVGVPIAVRVLPPVDTSAWAGRSTEACLEEVHARFREALPEDQLPALVSAGGAVA